MKKMGVMVMVLALGLSAAPAVAVNVTLSDAGLMLLDWYEDAYLPAVVVDRRDIPGPGVEFDIYFSIVEPGYKTVKCVSREGYGAGSLAGIDVSMYDAFELKFTLLAVDGINTPGIGGTLIVGALIGPYDDSLWAFQSQGVDFLPDTDYGTTAISSTPVRTNRISIIGFIAYIPSSMEGGWNPSGTTVTLLVEPVSGDVAIPGLATLVDYNRDGKVDLKDFSKFAKYWLADEPWVDIAPAPYGDGIVDYKDLAVLADYWLTAWRIPPLPAPASNPNPANDAFSVDINADLSWTAEAAAASHDVYFGTTNPPPFIHNQTAKTFDTGTMALATTYYWRIDGVNAWGKTTGTVWYFTTTTGPPPL